MLVLPVESCSSALKSDALEGEPIELPRISETIRKIVSKLAFENHQFRAAREESAEISSTRNRQETNSEKRKIKTFKADQELIRLTPAPI